jgi:Protein of unknown function (DUF4232)
MGRTRVALGGAGIVVVMVIGAGQVATASGRLARADRPASVVATKGSVDGRCQGRQLRIGLTQASPGASHHGYVLLFHNRGDACTVSGYPGVDAFSAQGHRLVSARRTKSGYLGGLQLGHPIPKVHLARGKTVSALVEWVTGLQSCPRAQSLKVTAPDAVRSVRLSPTSLGSERLCHLD